jgi:hypothetical protein
VSEEVQVIGETIKWKGYTLGAPVLRRGASLSHPLEDYFPDKDPELWFSWSQEKQNKWVRDNFDGCGVVFGTPGPSEVVETHHIKPLGMGHKERNNWPVLMIPVLRSFDGDRSTHSLLEAPSNQGLRIGHWDPLDTKGGLEVLDGEGRAIEHSKLWFYDRPSHDAVQEARQWESLILKAYESYVKAMYALGPLAMVAKDHVKVLGAKSFKDWAGQHAVVSAPFNLMKRLFDNLYEYYNAAQESLVHPTIMDSVRKTVPAEDLDEALQQMRLYCSPVEGNPSISDFLTNMKEAYPNEGSMVKACIVPCGVEITKMEVKDIKLVMEQANGGTVFKGWPVGDDD